MEKKLTKSEVNALAHNILNELKVKRQEKVNSLVKDDAQGMTEKFRTLAYNINRTINFAKRYVPELSTYELIGSYVKKVDVDQYIKEKLYKYYNKVVPDTPYLGDVEREVIIAAMNTDTVKQLINAVVKNYSI